MLQDLKSFDEDNLEALNEAGLLKQGWGKAKSWEIQKFLSWIN